MTEAVCSDGCPGLILCPSEARRGGRCEGLCCTWQGPVLKPVSGEDVALNIKNVEVSGAG